MSIKIVYSQSHTVFPKIILGILILFAVIMFVTMVIFVTSKKWVYYDE